MDPMLKSVLQILVHGKNTNSYKFALLRALADTSKTSGGTSFEISFATLAERFIEYYWPLTVKHRVRQGIDPAKDPVVMRMIRTLASDKPLSRIDGAVAFAKQDAVGYSALVANVARQAFGDVIPRFHMVRRHEVRPRLYKVSSAGIFVESAAATFLAAHADLLRFLAVAAWVKFTQPYSDAPRLFEKISGQRPERKTGSYRSGLSRVDEAKCFYCGVKSGVFVIDHFIPWSYVLEDRAWNLVFACKSCNGRKSDGLPEEPFLRNLMDRSSEWTQRIGQLPPRIAKDIKDWGPAHRLHEHMQTLRHQALQDGFPVWIAGGRNAPPSPGTEGE
jgi:hypothetical protein